MSSLLEPGRRARGRGWGRSERKLVDDEVAWEDPGRDGWGEGMLVGVGGMKPPASCSWVSVMANLCVGVEG